MDIFVRNLINDGYLHKHDTSLESGSGGMFTGYQGDDGSTIYVNHMEAYSLTESGYEFVKNLLEAKPLPR
jgi:hypothetical protein